MWPELFTNDIPALAGQQVQMGIIPLLIGAALAAKAVASGLKHKGQQKAGKAKFAADKAQFQQQDNSRIWGNQARQGMLRKLFNGRYAVPEDTFANVNAPRQYTGADPTTGAGFNFAGDLTNQAGDAVLNFGAGQLFKGGAGGAAGAAGAAQSAGAYGSAVPSGFAEGFAGDPGVGGDFGYPAPPPDFAPPVQHEFENFDRDQESF